MLPALLSATRNLPPRGGSSTAAATQTRNATASTSLCRTTLQPAPAAVRLPTPANTHTKKTYTLVHLYLHVLALHTRCYAVVLTTTPHAAGPRDGDTGGGGGGGRKAPSKQQDAAAAQLSAHERRLARMQVGVGRVLRRHQLAGGLPVCRPVGRSVGRSDCRSVGLLGGVGASITGSLIAMAQVPLSSEQGVLTSVCCNPLLLILSHECNPLIPLRRAPSHPFTPLYTPCRSVWLSWRLRR